jgi:hypothetical protein
MCTSSAKSQISKQAAQALAVTYILFLFLRRLQKMTTNKKVTTSTQADVSNNDAYVDFNGGVLENIKTTISAADSANNTATDLTLTLTDSTLQITSLNACLSLDTMEAKRISWENNEYKASNIVLYNLLADCLAFSRPLEPKIAKYRNMKLEAFFTQRQYNWKKDAKLSAKVIRAVFGDIDRKRLSTYAIVIDAALQAKVDPANLPAWITKKNGIQAIKLAKSATFISPQTKVDTTEQKLEAKKDNGLAIVKSQALSLLADADKMGENCVFIATQEADGSFTILSLTRKSSALNAAYLAVYSDEKAEEAKNAVKPYKAKAPKQSKKKVEIVPIEFATDLFDFGDEVSDEELADIEAVNDDTTLIEESKAA